MISLATELQRRGGGGGTRRHAPCISPSAACSPLGNLLANWILSRERRLPTFAFVPLFPVPTSFFGQTKRCWISVGFDLLCHSWLLDALFTYFFATPVE
uniref:Uncharacterized protein n=1 Tax=Physcomitrium patens TaxID=3218 RepID=A0A2K1J7M1_PHYPA|nr:hypothetical protein PHYPA_020639 [Physcomitrium patens]